MLLPFTAFADGGNSGDEPEKVERLDSVVVSVSRAGKKTPVTFTMLGKDQLRESNPINSLPMALSLQPSVVSYNEGGTGLGNSAITIRGSKGSQINVTLNGITLNDAESQEVFWVNIPSLQSLISSVQVQRGLGTSASGPGAFGASINMNTASVDANPFASVDLSLGSWNTFVASAAVSTGLSKSGFYANLAYSRGYTDGYIRNAKVNSQSLFAVLGWLHGNNSLRLTYLMGDQKSGITWDGISLDQYNTDRKYNDSGEYYDEYGNVHYYDNSIDRYAQHHIQMNYTHSFSDFLTWTTTVNFTRGNGYDEYFKQGKKLSKYGFDLSDKSDIIYRKGMANNYYVGTSSLKYEGEHLRLTAGVNVSKYDGGHFGKVLWAAVPGDGFDYSSINYSHSKDNAWYYNLGEKADVSVFARGEFDLSQKLTAYADLQYRFVKLDMDGFDDDATDITYKNDWNFVNPRVGMRYTFSPRHSVYASYAFGNREPGRSDIKENVKGELSPIKPEKMHDVEIGYEYTAQKFSASANVYMMEYDDILLETGRLSSSGYAIKANMGKGYRRGIELAAAWSPAIWARLDANLSLSTNKIKDPNDGYSESTVGGGKIDMLLSPSQTGMAKLSVSPWKGSAHNSLKSATFAIDGKFVGKQYIDNSELDEVEIPQYFVSNLTLSYEVPLQTGSLGFSAYVNNLFNNKYFAYGCRWEDYVKDDGSIHYGVGVYPQATANVMFKVSYRF